MRARRTTGYSRRASALTLRASTVSGLPPSFQAHRCLDASPKKLDNTNGMLEKLNYVKLSNR